MRQDQDGDSVAPAKDQGGALPEREDEDQKRPRRHVRRRKVKASGRRP